MGIPFASGNLVLMGANGAGERIADSLSEKFSNWWNGK